jgi:ribosome-associated protein
MQNNRGEPLEPIKLAREIVDVLVDKKAEDILLLDIQELTVIADYFVICSGTSFRMLRALAESVSDHLREHHKIKIRVDGEPQTGWLLGDYGDVVLHLFSPEQRDYYKLEEFWSEGKVILRMQ